MADDPPSVILSPIGDNPHPVERPHAYPSRRTADPPEARHHVLALLRITFLKSKWAHGVSCLVASALSTSASAVRLDEDLYGPDISAASDQLGQSRPAWLHLLLEAADLLRKLAASDAGESLKAVLRRLSRRLDSWSENRIRDVWHRDPRVKIRADEVSQLRALAEPKRKSETVHDSEELRATTRRPASPLGEVFEGRKVYTFNLSAVAIGLTDDVERSR